MPVHAVVGHVVAVLAPLAALLALVYACVPPARRGLGWSTVAVGAITAIAALWASVGGSAPYRQFRVAYGADAVRATTGAHARGAESLTVAAIVLALVFLVAALAPLRPGRPRTPCRWWRSWWSRSRPLRSCS